MPSEFEALEKVVSTVKSSGNIVKRILNWLESSQWEIPSEFGKNPFSKIKSFLELDSKYKNLVIDYEKRKLRSLLNVFYLEQLILIIKNVIEALDLLEDEFTKLKALKVKLKINDAVTFPNQKKQPYEGDPLNLTPEQIQKGEFPDDPRIKDPNKNKETEKFEETEKPEETKKSNQLDIDRVKSIEKELTNELTTLLKAIGKYNLYRFDETLNSNKIEFINKLNIAYSKTLRTSRAKLDLYREEVRTGKIKPKVKKETDAYLSGNLNEGTKKIKIKIKK